MPSSPRGFRGFTSSGPPTSTPWNPERSRILATASCEESTRCFGPCFPNQVIRADDLARAMVDVVTAGNGEASSRVFENRDIRALIRSLDSQRGAPAKGQK